MNNKKDSTVNQLSDLDKMHINLSNMNRKLVAANAEKALLQNENAELSHKLLMAELYLKYGRSPSDKINENGDFISIENELTKQDEEDDGA